MPRKPTISPSLGHYNELRLRNVDPAAVLRLERMAKDRGMQRNELARAILENAAMSPDLMTVNERYSALVKDVLVAIQANTEELERLSDLIERASMEKDLD